MYKSYDLKSELHFN